MKVNIPQLEQSYPTSKQIDALDINDSFHLMLNDQSKVIDAINKSKKNILDKYNKVDTFLKTSKGYQTTGQEGYVAIDRLGGDAVKIVDRMEFSYANFSPEILKGWQSSTRSRGAYTHTSARKDRWHSAPSGRPSPRGAWPGTRAAANGLCS